MTRPDTGVEAEMEAFADELSDEALDRIAGPDRSNPSWGACHLLCRPH
jgi:hypothetical protein